MNVPPAGFNFMGTGPPLPRNKYDRKYIASLQRTNLEMACWRRDPGGWQQGAANQPQNPAQMPIPWKNRNQEAPSVWLPVANPFTVWKLPFRGMTCMHSYLIILITFYPSFSPPLPLVHCPCISGLWRRGYLFFFFFILFLVMV